MKKVQGLHILGKVTLPKNYGHQAPSFYRQAISKIIAEAGFNR